jgi:hypothetical protein
MLDQPSSRSKRRVTLGLALAFITVGGAFAVWNQPRIKVNSAPKLRVVGRVWTQLPGVKIAGLNVQLVNRNQKYPPGPLLGMQWAATDALGRFELAGGAIGTGEGQAEVYLHSPPADDRWTYRPAVVMLRHNATVDGVEIELVQGVEVTGQFVDANSGNPVGPVRVGAIGPARAAFLGLFAPIRDTDNRGFFRYRLGPGQVELIAFGFPPGYQKSYPRGFSEPLRSPRVPTPALCRRCGFGRQETAWKRDQDGHHCHVRTINN